MKCRKTELEKFFFDYYFAQICKETKDTIDTFLCTFNDKGKLTQNMFNPKTINANYVQQITKSDLFLKDFNEYLEKDFNTDYSKTRKYKIGKVVEKCQEYFGNNKDGWETPILISVGWVFYSAKYF